jgi:hypothetical protein
MGGMNIPPFPRKIEIPDLENFFRTRLSTTVVMWPEQAIPLLCYMCFPNDEAARDDLLRTLWSWQDAPKPPAALDELRRVQVDWLRVADIFQYYCELVQGKHQERRGGPSIGKAITLVEANAQSRGTSAASLWKLWASYKDVAHLVTAAALIRVEARKRSSEWPPGLLGLSAPQILPFQTALLMPDLVLAVAMEFERLGLSTAKASKQSVLDRKTLWRIPAGINVAPIPPLIRKLRSQDRVILSARRAGKRGRA